MRKIQVQVFRKQQIVRIIFDHNKELRGKEMDIDIPFCGDWKDESREPRELLNDIIYHVAEGYKATNGVSDRGWDGQPFEIEGAMFLEPKAAQA